MTIQQGDKLPEGTFRTMGAGGPKEISTNDIFKGKKVVLFSVPGAFTPTCHAKHLPSYLDHLAALGDGHVLGMRQVERQVRRRRIAIRRLGLQALENDLLQPAGQLLAQLARRLGVAGSGRVRGSEAEGQNGEEDRQANVVHGAGSSRHIGRAAAGLEHPLGQRVARSPLRSRAA